MLAFDIDLITGTVHSALPLEGIVHAPFGTLSNNTVSAALLTNFIDGRRIFPSRDDAQRILEATGMRSVYELAFRGGGFSHSDPFWYRAKGSTLSWKTHNLFDNSRDPTLGRAIIQRNSGALAKASLRTPDVTIGGGSRKAWTHIEGKLRLLKAPLKRGAANTMGEVLTSRLLTRLLPKGEYLSYELIDQDGEP